MKRVSMTTNSEAYGAWMLFRHPDADPALAIAPLTAGAAQ